MKSDSNPPRFFVFAQSPPAVKPAPDSLPLAPATSQRLMLLGVVGMVLVTLHFPAPVLCSLTLIGIGADADLARRGQSLPVSVSSFARLMHGLLYVGLYTLAWGAMYDLELRGHAVTSSGRLLLVGDLAVSLLLLIALAVIRHRKAQPA